MSWFKKTEDKKIERSFTEKLNRRNRWLACLAFVEVVVMVMAAHFCLDVMRDSIKDGNFKKVYMLTVLLIVISIGSAWALRGWQRHDLYSVVIGMSGTQLRRIAGEIADEIEKLDSEQSVDIGTPEAAVKKKETA